MKKLLSLLSVLTISGNAIPTTIAASPYQKENNNNNLRETMESDSNNKKEKNNKIISTHKNKKTLWKYASIFGNAIAKTINDIKNNWINKSKNNNFKTNNLKKLIKLDSNKNKRQLNQKTNNNYWIEKFPILKSQIEKIKEKITDIKILNENNKGGNLLSGDTYIGTTNGVYLIHGKNKHIDKFNNLNFAIKDIFLDGNGSAYITNNNGEVYHLNLYGWDSEKINGDNFQGKITIIKILENDSNVNQWIKKGDILLGTTNGLYSINQKNNKKITKKMSTVNDEIKDIILDKNNNRAYIITKDNIFYLYFIDWSYEKIKNITKNNVFEIIYKQRIVITTNNSIYSPGVVLNNKVYFGSQDHNVYEYDPITNTQKIVIKTNGMIHSSGVVLNNKIYFGSFDHNVYKYDPTTNTQKIVIKTNDSIRSSGVVLNNKVYFGSFDHNVYEYDPTTNTQKIVIKTNNIIGYSGVVLNNKIYFGSFDHNVYEYDPTTNTQKIVIKTNDSIRSSGVVLNNKVYFGSFDHNVYEYDPTTNTQKIVIKTNDSIRSSGVVLNNKIYFGSFDHNVYEYDPTTNTQKIVIKTNDSISSSGVVLNNKVYFGSQDHNVYEYDSTTNTQKIVIKTNSMIYSSGVVLNNKVYFVSWDHNVYEYDPTTNTQKIVITANDMIHSSGVVLNNKLYFGSKDGNVYEYYYHYNISELIFKLDESNIINLEKQVKKGLYLYNKKQNPNYKIKDILNINLENLKISNLIISEKQNNKIVISKENLKSACKDYNSTFINNSDEEQTQNTPSCSEQITKTSTFQKMNGFSKSNSESKNKNWNTNLNAKVTAKASSSLGIPFIAEGKIEIGFEFGGEYTWGESKNYTITDTSTSSDTEIKTITETETINSSSQPIKIPPHSKISTSNKIWKNKIELTLNAFQKVEGIVSADFVDINNNKKTISISIKDAMLNLLENKILPSKIKINDNDSVNFCYVIKNIEEIIIQETKIDKAIHL